MVTMSKQIKISDELYEFLKSEAQKNYRPIGKQLEFLLDTDKVTKTTITKVDVKPLTPPSKRFPEAKVMSIEEKPKFTLTGKLCKEHQVDVDICKNMKH